MTEMARGWSQSLTTVEESASSLLDVIGGFRGGRCQQRSAKESEGIKWVILLTPAKARGELEKSKTRSMDTD